MDSDTAVRWSRSWLLEEVDEEEEYRPPSKRLLGGPSVGSVTLNQTKRTIGKLADLEPPRLHGVLRLDGRVLRLDLLFHCSSPYVTLTPDAGSTSGIRSRTLH